MFQHEVVFEVRVVEYLVHRHSVSLQGTAWSLGDVDIETTREIANRGGSFLIFAKA